MKNTYRYHSSVPKQLSQLVERVTRPANRKRGFTEHRLLSEWAIIVGEELASRTLPQKMSHSRNRQEGACLHILAEPAWAMELQYMEPVLLDRIATFFGYRAVIRLMIHQGNLPPRPAIPIPKPAIEPLPDDETFAGLEEGELKETLRRMGALLRAKL